MLTRITTALALGPWNIGRVFEYRARLKAGIHPVQRLAVPAGFRPPFFRPVRQVSALAPPGSWRQAADYFGWMRPELGGKPPDWYRNQLTGVVAANTGRPWWMIPDFDPVVGDVKGVWEASRFDWVAVLAQQARAGDADAIPRLNAWLADWCERNPPYQGHNWKCGQEASIRAMHLAVAALVLDQIRDSCDTLVELLAAHLQRIEPTLSYAMAQDNNHGTSEAAALFIGGAWLGSAGDARGARWAASGRRWLENRAARLIQPDGSFSQYSVNYHRLMLDTLSLAEVWRRCRELPPFSERFYTRAASAAGWLRAMTDSDSGDAANLGENDGANLLPLTDAGYRDYRPAVDLACALFQRGAAYAGPGPWQTAREWLGVEAASTLPPQPDALTFDAGGFAVVQRGRAKAILRYPRFRFRPSHADALHVDLWEAGVNLLRDAGTFSYNTDAETRAYFSGVRGHNTVQFDDRDQMPRLGRFLWGGWLTTTSIEPAVATAPAAMVAASYSDANGATHHRRVELADDRLTVTDRLSGFAVKAVLRWRLRPATAWTSAGGHVTDGRHHLTVTADVPMVRSEIVSGHESRYYGERTVAPVFEVELAAPGTVTSEYRWRS